jgi:SAM-dependent methyltransferase
VTAIRDMPITGVTPTSRFHPGESTAVGSNVAYRLGKIRDILKGEWLDCGCADGGYTEALVEYGAERAIGIDVDESRIEKAKSKRRSARTDYYAYAGRFPLPDHCVDGVLLNEVLEHVDDEHAVLREIHRVLRRGGKLVVMSPNRWFPFEGHGMQIGNKSFGFPIPLLPWLPSRFAMKFMAARNYWPRELRNVVRHAGFEVTEVGFILPVLEVYAWLPAGLIRFYRKVMPLIERTPLRRFGVSTLVIATPVDTTYSA